MSQDQEMRTGTEGTERKRTSDWWLLSLPVIGGLTQMGS